MNKTGKTVFYIILISLFTKVLGFLRELLLAYFYGTSDVVDAYLLAVAIPTIFFGWLTSLSVGYTPLYVDAREEKGRQEGDNYTFSLLAVSIVVSILCVGFGLLFSKQLVNISGHGFEEATKVLTEEFLRKTIWLIVFNTPIHILTSYLNCNKRPVLAMLTTIILSSGQASFIIISGYCGRKYLPVGILSAYILQFLMLMYCCYKSGFSFRLAFVAKSRIKRTFVLAVPIFFTTLSTEINAFVDKMLGSFLAEGSISALTYAGVLHDFFRFVFGAIISSVVYPQLSEYASLKQEDKLVKWIEKGICYICIIFIPLSVGVIILGKPLIEFVFLRGEFNLRSSELTVGCFQAYCVGLCVVVLNDFFGKLFNALKKSKVNMVLGTTTIVSNIILNITFIQLIGLAGLPLASSMSAVIVMPFYIKQVKKIFSKISMRYVKKVFLKVCFAAMIMGGTVTFWKFVLIQGIENKAILLGKIIFITLFGVGVYGSCGYLLRIDEIKEMIAYLKKDAELKKVK